MRNYCDGPITMYGTSNLCNERASFRVVDPKNSLGRYKSACGKHLTKVVRSLNAKTVIVEVIEKS